MSVFIPYFIHMGQTVNILGTASHMVSHNSVTASVACDQPQVSGLQMSVPVSQLNINPGHWIWTSYTF